ncbi:DUF1266 domain-containing protein [Gordonia malaquae]|uniref:DUF1266 domain-containing protein n=1 Tax=Gordonia malaquae TaxID=410332 RepID=UPI0030FE477A
MALFNRRRDDADPLVWGSRDNPERIATAVNRDYTTADIPVDPQGTLYGPVAQGLSLSGPMASPQNVKWNSLTDLGNFAAAGEVEQTLTQVWGIEDEEYWFTVLNRLVAGQYGDSIAYHAADIRTAAKRRRDVHTLDDNTWAHELTAESDRLEAPDGYADALIEAIGPIRMAEQQLRAARLLAADEEVEALSGYDLVRVCNVARWGVAFGWGGPHVVRNVALAARDSVLANHSSWRSYALSVTAGRMVTYPDTYGREVVDAIEWVRPYLDSRNSPWNHLPFPTEPVLGND